MDYQKVVQLFIALFLYAHAPHILGIKWLGLNMDESYNWSSRDCSKANLLLTRQHKVCRNNLNLMKYVAESAKLAKEECKEQFRSRLWDCSTINRAPSYGYDLRLDTKESAFVYALSSAALTFTISKACLAGKIPGCGCPKRAVFVTADKANNVRQRDFGGCPEVTSVGYKFARQFSNAEFRKKLPRNSDFGQRNRIKRHNIKLGGQVVRDLLSVNCRCHGVTGSCQTKHCMKRLPTFEEVAQTLVTKYDRARPLIYTQYGKVYKLNKAKGDLLYLDQSPNYCSKNMRAGTTGTKGRECSRDIRRKDSCERLCCGRGYDLKTIEIVERCGCKYVWCCYVKCNKCKKTRITYTCR